MTNWCQAQPSPAKPKQTAIVFIADFALTNLLQTMSEPVVCFIADFALTN